MRLSRRLPLWAIPILAAMPAGAVALATQPDTVYQLIAKIAVAGDGDWNYLSIDAQSRRLYAAHSDHIDVIDLDHDRAIATITDTPGVHGFITAPQLGRGFASDSDTSQVSIIDMKTLATLSRVTTGTGPDAIVYESRHAEIYTFNARGNSSTIIDAGKGRRVATIALPGKPGFAVVDPDADRVFVTIQDKNLVVAIDATRHKIAGLWQIMPGIGPSALAIDTVHHRLLVGCENQRMLMVDAQVGRVIASLPTGRPVNAVAYDPLLQLAFGASGAGTMSVAREISAEELSLVQTVQTAMGARAMALDPITHRIYLATADPSAPGSARILVFGPGTR